MCEGGTIKTADATRGQSTETGSARSIVSSTALVLERRVSRASRGLTLRAARMGRMEARAGMPRPRAVAMRTGVPERVFCISIKSKPLTQLLMNRNPSCAVPSPTSHAGMA